MLDPDTVLVLLRVTLAELHMEGEELKLLLKDPLPQNVAQPEEVAVPDMEGSTDVVELRELGTEVVAEKEMEMLAVPQEDAVRLLRRVGKVLEGVKDKEPELVPHVDTETDKEADMDTE